MRIAIGADGRVDPFDLGMEWSDVMARLEGAPAPFRRNEFTDEVTQAFDDEGLHFRTDAGGCVSAVSVFRPNECHVCGVQVLGRPLRAVVDDLPGAGINARIVDVGAQCEIGDAGIVFVEVERLDRRGR